MPAPLVHEHLDAFNAHDTERLLAGLADDAVWITGSDVTRGRAALAELFDAGLWAMQPSLELRTLVDAEDAAAAEVLERITVDGVEHTIPLGVFFRFAGGRLTHVTVYREGNASIQGLSRGKTGTLDG